VDTALQRTLGPVMLWGLGVGFVISGEYFGWNLGLPVAGSYGMMAATAVVTVMYVTFILSYTELACAIPRAGGAFVYAARAFGPIGGLVAGLAQLVEFVFAPPAIAMAIAAYVTQRYPGLSPELVAIAAYGLFTALNAWGVRQAATFELVVTVLAVAEILVFVAIVGPHFSWTAFSREPLPNGWVGAFDGLPFAIWFYLALEGVANAAEEAREPQRSIPLGFGAAMATLLVLATMVFFFAIGVDGWRSVVFPAGSDTPSDAPLPLALAHVVDPASWMYTMLLGIGLLGLIASFHGIIFAAGRATMELGRSGYAPAILGGVHATRHTPLPALLANMGLGIAAILTGHTGEIITLAVLGALVLYATSMASLFRLRRAEPALERPYRAVAYPVFPAIALGLALVCLVAVVRSAPGVAATFVGIFAVGATFRAVSRRA
jgi:ethanolamine permease